ncbi:penicillin-binding protein 1A [Anaerobranca californiensis DSM 14826]|jgi:penicillin-binding protein 1A|uniref:Penicillin-binding protein 1A n=1 Tax=Anaerobranca californiensis DSM 14826 TaxID=1120989 RepID=A0A1M6PTQ5_9FIRM|nr:transglycosylase domain-containing protein [Anaerobranca californiensis]SHK11292.1 penicillin-binding protein 1A [Anaerobranca californiensis DSM 14826]
MENKKRPPKKGKVLLKVFKLILILSLLIGFLGGGIALGMIVAALQDLPEFNRDRLENPSLPSVVLDRNGAFLGEAYNERRIRHTFDEFPQDLINAFLATEDRNFFQHPGFDIRGMGRAFLSNLQGDSISGGSTITQQLAKQIFLHQGKVMDRKIQELYLALKIEKLYTKEEIMEFYLNSAVVYGWNEFGVGAAARALFGKTLDELTLGEMALLAGIPNWPVRYDPRVGSKEAAINRRNYVLSRMYNAGYITKEQFEEAKKEELVLVSKGNGEEENFERQNYHWGPFMYAVEETKKILIDLYNYTPQEAHYAVYNHGFTIKTTINLDYQKVAESVINDDRNFPTKYKGPNQQEEASATLIDVKTGEILALVTGRNAHPHRNAVLRPITSFRQPGSTIKPILSYAPAFEQRLLFPGSVLNDQPIKYPDPSKPKGFWTPENANLQFNGLVTVREALVRSLNTTAVISLLEIVGIRNGERFAYNMGLSGYQNITGSAALGSNEVTALEITAAYSAFANKGVLAEPYFIKEIIDRNGRVIYRNEPKQRVVMSEETAYLITDVLTGVSRPPGTAVNVRNFFQKTAALKTGTTDDRKDLWLIGYTPHYSLGVWLGWDLNNRTLPTGQWISTIWGKIMEGVHKNIPDTPFERPNNIVEVPVSTKSGKLPSPLTPPEYIRTDLFVRGSEPTEVCDAFVEVTICRVSGKLASEHCPPHHRQSKVMLAPRNYQVTTDLWDRGAGRMPKDVEIMAPTEICDMHEGGSNVSLPRNLTAELTPQGIKLKWEAPSELLGFNIYRKSPDSNFVLLNDVPLKAKEYLDIYVNKDVEYSYYVTGLTSDGSETRASNTIKITLPSSVQRVTSFKLEFRNNRVEISWDPALHATNYRIFRSTNENSGFTEIHSTSNLFYFDTNIEKGKTYYYYIVAEGASPSPTKSIQIPKNNGNGN